MAGETYGESALKLVRVTKNGSAKLTKIVNISDFNATWMTFVSP
jgi:hypothetical protein